MFIDPLKDSLTSSVKSFSQTLWSALWEPLLSMKATFQKSIRSKPVADALARAHQAVHRQRLLEHLEAVIMTSLCTPAHKKMYKQFVIGTGREQFAQHTTFKEAAQAFHGIIPTIVSQHKQDLSAQEMKHVALLIEKIQSVIDTTVTSYPHAALSDSAGAFGESFAKDTLQKQTTTHIHELRDAYLQDAKQLLSLQQELLSHLKHMGTPQFKINQQKAKALLDDIVKLVQKMTMLEKQLTAAEKSVAQQFDAWMQQTMRGSKQTQRHIPDTQNNYLQAAQKVLDQREQVQQSWIAELQTRATAKLPLEDMLAKEASFWLQWSSLNAYATWLEAQAYTLDIQLYQGWLILLEQQQDMLHTLHAHTKAYALIASLMSHIKKQHLRLSQDILQVLIERKVIHNESKVESRLDRVQRVHTVIQHWIRDDERASLQRKDYLQALVMQEGRIPLLKWYLTRMHEYATAIRWQHVLEANMRTLNLQQHLFPYILQAITALQSSHTNAEKLLTLQREDAQKTYAFKPSAEQEKVIAELDMQYTRTQQAGQLLEHLHTHAQWDQDAVEYLLWVYRTQTKQLKLQTKKVWSQIKKLLPSVKKQIASYPWFPFVTKDTV